MPQDEPNPRTTDGVGSAPQRLALEEYLCRLPNTETRYHVDAVWYQFWAWLFQVAALVATASTTVLAGVYQPGGKPGFFLVALPALATFLLAVRSGLRLSDIWRLREEAEIEL